MLVPRSAVVDVKSSGLQLFHIIKEDKSLAASQTPTDTAAPRRHAAAAFYANFQP